MALGHPVALALGHPVGHPVDIGLQAIPRYDAGGRLKEKWLPNQVNTRYNYNSDNTITQGVNRSLTTTIISQHDYLYDAYGNRSYSNAPTTAARRIPIRLAPPWVVAGPTALIMRSSSLRP